MGTAENVTWLRKAATIDFDALRTANIPQLDNAEALAELTQPDDDIPPRRLARAAAAASPPQPLPPPVLRPGARVQVLWGETWFSGTFTSSRAGIGVHGQPARLYRIYYDAAGRWKAQAKWHDLANERWQQD